MVSSDALKRGREEYLRKLKAGLIERLNPHQRALKNPTSLRKAVDAKCWECNGGDNWINRTKYCNIIDCPLWHVRKNVGKVTKEECLNFSFG